MSSGVAALIELNTQARMSLSVLFFLIAEMLPRRLLIAVAFLMRTSATYLRTDTSTLPWSATTLLVSYLPSAFLAALFTVVIVPREAREANEISEILRLRPLSARSFLTSGTTMS